MARRKPSVSTLRTKVSHLRTALRRLGNMKLSLPVEGASIPKVKMFGANLVIDGQVYKPADLESLKGQKRDFRTQAIGQLQDQLKAAEYALIKETGKIGKLTGLDEFEADFAAEGIDRLEFEEEIQFREWLNSGSDGWKKNQFYHVYGAPRITRGYIMGFLRFNDVNTIDELIEKLGE